MISVGLYLFACAALVLAALVAVISHVLFARTDRSFREGLSRQGLELRSATFAEHLELRSSDGIVVRRLVPLTLGSATAATTPELQRCTVAEMPLHEADLVVCRLAIAQAVFGPFLPPRVLTGDTAFDAEFGVFEPPAKPGAYRGSGPPGSLSWSKPDVLAALRASGFVAMQITDGTVRLATDEKRGRARNAPLVHQLDLVDLARRLRAAITNPSAPRPPLPNGAASGLGASVETVALFAALILFTLIWLTPGTFGLGVLACPDRGVFHHVIRPPQDVCRISPTQIHPTNLGTLTAVVVSSMIAVVSIVVAVGLARRRRHLASVAPQVR